MGECKYGEHCMCATCEFQLNNSGRRSCSECDDCYRENKQVHDVWSCTKYERKIILRS